MNGYKDGETRHGRTATENRRNQAENLDMPDPVMYNNEITEVEYSILFCSRSGCVLVHLCKEGKQDGRKENNIDLCGLESFGR